VIRFNCPNCGRLCEVFPALAHMSLLCKGCGQAIVVPEASTAAPAPPSPPPPKAPPLPKAPPPPPVPAKTTSLPATAHKPTDAGEEDDLPFLIPETEVSPDIDFDMRGPTAASESDAHRARMSGVIGAGSPRALPVPPPAPPTKRKPPEPPAPSPPAAPKASALQKLLPIVVDIAAGLILLVIGAFLGSVLAGKSTRDVWNEAGSSVTLPSMELLMWLAPPVVFALIYGLLISRGKSLGARLRRSR
jgi:hypothetical protein